jgi:hypothetical protein
VTVGGKVKILFSQFDVSSGFLGTNTWGIVGYEASTAEGIGRNVVLFAQEQAAGK